MNFKNNKMETNLGAFSALLVLISSSANAGFISKNKSGLGDSISAGTATYTISSFVSTIGLSNDMIISDGVVGDLMFESGWLYRVNGDSSESKFPVPSMTSFDSDNVLITWNDVDARGLFSAELLIEITQPVSQSAVLTSTLKLYNISASDVSLDMFFYNDIDVNGTFGNDVAALISSPDYIGIMDGLDFSEFRAGSPNYYQVTPSPILRAELLDSGIDNLDDSGLPMPLDDFTGAFQWSTQTIPVDGEYHLQTISSFNTVAPEPEASIVFVDNIFQNGFEQDL